MAIMREAELIEKIKGAGLIPEKVRALQFKNTIVLDCDIDHFIEKASAVVGDKELNWNKEVYFTYGFYDIGKIAVDESLAMDEDENSKAERDAYNATVDSLDQTQPRSLMLAFDSDDVLYVFNQFDNWVEDGAKTDEGLARVLAVLSASN